MSLVAPHNFPPHHEPAPAATRPPERSVCKGCGAPKSGPGHGKIRGTATFAVHGKCTQPCKCGRSRAEHRLDPFGVLCKKQRKELAAQTAPPAAAAAPSASPTAAAAAAATAAAAAAATAATAAPVHPRPYVAGDSFHYALSPYLPSPPLPLRPPQLLLPPPLLQFALALPSWRSCPSCSYRHARNCRCIRPNCIHDPNYIRFSRRSNARRICSGHASHCGPYQPLPHQRRHLARRRLWLQPTSPISTTRWLTTFDLDIKQLHV